MDLRFKNRRAMVTVELAVTLVLVVVALFVTLGLFSNNLRDMVTNSNVKNLFNGNGTRTFFSLFDKKYRDAQVYVQVMGEQGLQILRKKANNGVVSAVATLPKNGGSVENAATFSTISYLSQIITVIMGNQIICDTMPTPSTAECGTAGVPGAKYTVSVTGTSLTITPAAGNSYAKGITITTTDRGASLADSKNAHDRYSTKDKFKFISNLSSDNSSTSNALVKTIGYFNSVISRGGSFATADSVDQKIITLLDQIAKNMKTAKDECMGCPLIFWEGGQCVYTEGCGKDADVVNEGDLDEFNDDVKKLKESIYAYAAEADCIVDPKIQGCTPTTTTNPTVNNPSVVDAPAVDNSGDDAPAANTGSGKFRKVLQPTQSKLPVDPRLLPSYSANAKPTAIHEIAYISMPDKVAIASYVGNGAIVAGIADSFAMTNPLSDTSNMIAMCGALNLDGASCPKGESLDPVNNCCYPTCDPDSYNAGSGICKSCPSGATGTGSTCICPNGGTFSKSSGTCSGGITNPPVVDDDTICMEDMFKTGTGSCGLCPPGSIGNGKTCDCGPMARFNQLTAACICANGGIFTDSQTELLGTCVVSPAAVIANLCSSGVGTCSGTNNSTITVSATNSLGTAVNVILSTGYVASPLTDARLSLVSAARTDYLKDRVKIFKLYNKMFDVVWNGSNSDNLFKNIKEDNYNTTSSCDAFKKGLADLASGAGIISMNTDIITHSSKCIPAVK